MASYVYDAWGNIISESVSSAHQTASDLNPFRYRGYYYDQETGFYYLQSRYYDPTTGRFLNADSSVNANGDLQGFNMYAYCSNNPVMYRNDSGEGILAAVIIIAVSGIVGASLGALNAAATGGDIAQSAVEGFLTGIASATLGLTLPASLAFGFGVLAGSGINLGVQYFSQKIAGEQKPKIDVLSVVKAGLQTGLSAAIPAFGKGANNAIDAFATALTWTEASILIVITDIAVTNTINAYKNPPTPSTKSTNKFAKTVARI